MKPFARIIRHCVQAAVFLALCALLVGLILPSLGGSHRHHPQIKDASQVRGIHQGMVLFSQQ